MPAFLLRETVHLRVHWGAGTLEDSLGRGYIGGLMGERVQKEYGDVIRCFAPFTCWITLHGKISKCGVIGKTKIEPGPKLRKIITTLQA